MYEKCLSHVLKDSLNNILMISTWIHKAPLLPINMVLEICLPSLLPCKGIEFEKKGTKWFSIYLWNFMVIQWRNQHQWQGWQWIGLNVNAIWLTLARLIPKLCQVYNLYTKSVPLWDRLGRSNRVLSWKLFVLKSPIKLNHVFSCIVDNFNPQPLMLF